MNGEDERSPYATLFGHVLETPRVLPNDQANQRFVDVAGRKRDTCIGQIGIARRPGHAMFPATSVH